MKLLISIVLGSLVPSWEGPKAKKIELSGTVVARDVLTPLTNISHHNISSEVFIVRVEKPKELAEESRYIKVHYGRCHHVFHYSEG